MRSWPCISEWKRFCLPPGRFCSTQLLFTSVSPGVGDGDLQQGAGKCGSDWELLNPWLPTLASHRVPVPTGAVRHIGLPGVPRQPSVAAVLGGAAGGTGRAGEAGEAGVRPAIEDSAFLIKSDMVASSPHSIDESCAVLPSRGLGECINTATAEAVGWVMTPACSTAAVVFKASLPRNGESSLDRALWGERLTQSTPPASKFDAISQSLAEESPREEALLGGREETPDASVRSAWPPPPPTPSAWNTDIPGLPGAELLLVAPPNVVPGIALAPSSDMCVPPRSNPGGTSTGIDTVARQRWQRTPRMPTEPTPGGKTLPSPLAELSSIVAKDRSGTGKLKDPLLPGPTVKQP